MALCLILVFSVCLAQDGMYPPADATSSRQEEQIPTYAGGPPPPGSILISSFFDDAVLLYDPDGNLLGNFTAGNPPSDPEGLLFRDNGNLLVVSRNTHSVLEYGRSGEFIGTLVDDGLLFPHGLIWSNDGNLLIASTGAVVEADGETGELIGDFADVPATAIDLEYGPNGNLFVSVPVNDEVIEVDAETGEVLGTFASGGGLVSSNQLLFGGAGPDLFVGGDDPHAIFRFDGATGEFLSIFASGHDMEYPGPGATHPNGNLLVTTGFGNTVIEFDFETGEFLGTFADGLDFPTFVAVVPAEEPPPVPALSGGFETALVLVMLVVLAVASYASGRSGW